MTAAIAAIAANAAAPGAVSISECVCGGRGGAVALQLRLRYGELFRERIILFVAFSRVIRGVGILHALHSYSYISQLILLPMGGGAYFPYLG